MTLDPNSNRFTNNFLLWEDSNIHASREDCIMNLKDPSRSSNNCQLLVSLLSSVALYLSPIFPPEYLRLILNILSNSNCISHETLFHGFHLQKGSTQLEKIWIRGNLNSSPKRYWKSDSQNTMTLAHLENLAKVSTPNL